MNAREPFLLCFLPLFVLTRVAFLILYHHLSHRETLFQLRRRWAAMLGLAGNHASPFPYLRE